MQRMPNAAMRQTIHPGVWERENLLVTHKTHYVKRVLKFKWSKPMKGRQQQHQTSIVTGDHQLREQVPSAD